MQSTFDFEVLTFDFEVLTFDFEVLLGMFIPEYQIQPIRLKLSNWNSKNFLRCAASALFANECH